MGFELLPGVTGRRVIPPTTDFRCVLAVFLDDPGSGKILYVPFLNVSLWRREEGLGRARILPVVLPSWVRPER